MIQNSQGSYSAYKNAKITTASQAQLIIMLYTEAIRQINLAIGLMRKNEGIKNYEAINNALNKTLDIIGELTASLDFEKGSDIAHNLFSIYSYFSREVSEANLSKKPQELPQIVNLMTSLCDAWKAIDSNKPDPSKSINIAG